MCWCRGGRIHEKNKIKKRHNNFQGRGFCVAFLILKGPEFIIKVKNKAVYIKKTKKNPDISFSHFKHVEAQKTGIQAGLPAKAAKLL